MLETTLEGSSADSTFLLHEIIKQDVSNYCTVFFDPESVEKCVQKELVKSKTICWGKVDDKHGIQLKLKGLSKNY
ncbi:MAG: hypothetical protein CM15mP91_0440 [Chloroflexota bacterium]|nr:MAG: hypothetical protein CM15mP91_0440 [Chloroflexota bacterium]